jgi:hypothetical protein
LAPSYYYYEKIEHIGSEAESERYKRVSYEGFTSKEVITSSKSRKSRNSLYKASKSSKKGPVAESNIQKRYMPHRLPRQGSASPSDKSGKSNTELEIESDAVKHGYDIPYRHYSHEPATDILSDRAKRFYDPDMQHSHAPESSPGIPVIIDEMKLSEIEGVMERRFYPQARQQRHNPETVTPKAIHGAPETEPIHTAFANKIFASGPMNTTVPLEVVHQQRDYTPISEQTFGDGPAIHQLHEVSKLDIRDDQPFRNEEEVKMNEFTQLDKKPTALTCFTNRMDLVAAVDEYLLDNGPNTLVAQTYGWPIGTWCVSPVKSFRAVFSASRNPAASTFNENLSHWDVSNATSTQSMFEGSAIDQDFSSWNTSAVKSMNSMFSDTQFFRGQGLSKWDTRSVTDMSFMFSHAMSLREDISLWNVSSVKSTWGMFQFASSFNHDLSPWTLSGLVSMDLMFHSAKSFRHDLCSWVDHLPKDLVNTYGVFTMSNCPNASDPNLAADSPGPFCFDC